MASFISKIGTNKGLERSRVWIEGNRLSNAGFHVGTRYSRSWTDKLTLQIEPDAKYKVSGKGTHPIIDITGQHVREYFEGHDQVEVDYEPGKITIRPAQ